MPEPRYRVLTTVVSVPPLAAFHLIAIGQAYRTLLERGEHFLHTWPRGDHPVILLAPDCWRVHIGGVAVALNVVKKLSLEIPTLPKKNARALVLVTDTRVARDAYALDITAKRRSAWLQYVPNGEWVLRMRWEPRKPRLVHSSKGDRHAVTKAFSRRWAIAPAEWPRDKRGALMKTQTVMRMLGRETTERLLRFK